MLKRSTSGWRCGARSSFLLLIPGLLCVGCSESHPERNQFLIDGIQLEVEFRGERSDDTLFGAGGSLLDHVSPAFPEGSSGVAENTRPGWLEFEYRLGGKVRRLLIARQPVMSMVAWEDVARAGAALGDGSLLRIGDREVAQDTTIRTVEGNSYRVRFPQCGQHTMDALSEWNLLIGGVHEGDVDFSGDRHGWISTTYSDARLKVGHGGSLSWCMDAWGERRVARGYFFVSRFLATYPDSRSVRLQWRPVLEYIQPDGGEGYGQADSGDQQVSPNGRVVYAGIVTNTELFGPKSSIDSLLQPDHGFPVGLMRPDWLKFQVEDREILIAATPVRSSISWNAIARMGAVSGDGRWLRAGWWWYRQDAAVEDIVGRRYRVRLLDCGTHTLDHHSEWNRLIGAVHQGDADFVRHPAGFYGWIADPLNDIELNIGDITDRLGGSTWCSNQLRIGLKSHAVNRGYLTVSRFHATAPSYSGTGFGWRPVLELDR